MGGFLGGGGGDFGGDSGGGDDFDASSGGSFGGGDDSASSFAGGDFGLDGGSFMPMLAAADGVSPLSGGNLMGSASTPVQTTPFGGAQAGNPGNQSPLAQAASAAPLPPVQQPSAASPPPGDPMATQAVNESQIPSGLRDMAVPQGSQNLNTLQQDRARYAQELQNSPGLKQRVMQIASSEQGSNALGNQQVIESMMNRASMSGTTLAQQARYTSAGGYYAGGPHGMSPHAAAALQGALGGSNLSNFATDNASNQPGNELAYRDQSGLRRGSPYQGMATATSNNSPIGSAQARGVEYFFGQNGHAYNSWKSRMAGGHAMSTGLPDGGAPTPPASIPGTQAAQAPQAPTESTGESSTPQSTQAAPAAQNAPASPLSPADQQWADGRFTPGTARNPLPGLTPADYGTGRQASARQSQQPYSAMLQYGLNPTPANAGKLFSQGMQTARQGGGLIPQLLGTGGQRQQPQQGRGLLGIIGNLIRGGLQGPQHSQGGQMGGFMNPYMGGMADPSRNMTGSASNSGPMPARLQAAQAWGGSSGPSQMATPDYTAMIRQRASQMAQQGQQLAQQQYASADSQPSMAAQGSQMLNMGNLGGSFDPFSKAPNGPAQSMYTGAFDPTPMGPANSFNLPQGSPAARAITQAQNSAPQPSPDDQDAATTSDADANSYAKANGIDTSAPATPQPVPAAQATKNIQAATTPQQAVTAAAQSDHPVHQAAALVTDSATAVQAAPKVQVATSGTTNSTLQALPEGFNKPGPGTPTFNKLTPQQQSDALAMASYTMKPLPGTAQKSYPSGAEGYRNVVAAARELNPYFDENQYAGAKDFKGDGKYASNMGVVRTASEHLNQLSNDYDTLVQRLGPSVAQYPTWSSLKGAFANQINSDPKLAAAFARVSTDSMATSTELAKAWRGVGSLSSEEAQNWDSKVNAMKSGPAAFGGAASAMGDLLNGRYDTMNSMYRSTYHRDYGKESNGDMDMTPFHNMLTAVHSREQQYSSPNFYKPVAPAQPQGQAGTPQGAVQTGSGPTNSVVNPQASAAQQWLAANPNDPRAAAVRSKLQQMGIH